MVGGQKAVDLVTGKTKVEYYFDPTLVLEENNRPQTNPTKTPRKGARNELPGLSGGTSSSLVLEDALFQSEHLFLPCSIVKSLDIAEHPKAALVKTSDGALYKIRDATKLVALSPLDRTGVSDVLNLSDVSEQSLLHTLRLRYKRDDIYTTTGPILISINPYKSIEGYYSVERMHLYRDFRLKQHNLPPSLSLSANTTPISATTSLTTKGVPPRSKGISSPIQPDGTLEPHLFQVADRAYAALMNVHNSVSSSQRALEVELENETSTKKLTLSTSGHVNQSIIISGESGAGKTEATKIIMQYLARITAESDSNHETHGRRLSGTFNSSTMEDRVLSANPLLESFGNARTLRNDNSSRFGKFIQIHFHQSGIIAGATISNYLLEKTRITEQVDGERNYHIFYQLITGAHEELLQALGLDKSKLQGFHYITHPKNPSRRDVTAFEETKACLSNIGVCPGEAQQTLFGIVAAVLFLGNIEFEEGGASGGDVSSSISSPENLEKACELLGLETSEVSSAILSRQISVGGKTILKPQSVAQARDKRDALAKLCYSSLFQWLVDQINLTISNDSQLDEPNERILRPAATFDGFSPEPKTNAAEANTMTAFDVRGFIGVLDIYGFEHFDVNGFEQLLINYANENMQRHFNKHLFEVEQEIYANEGVDWTYITFNDNRPCLELLEGGGSFKVGILSTLDDAWGGVGTAAEKDVKFVSQLHQTFGGTPTPKHEYYVTPKFGSDRQFGICHYAGEVRYTANGFVEKNMESLSNELKDLGRKSSIKFVRDIFQVSSTDLKEPASPSVNGADSRSARRSAIRGTSVSAQFRSSLQKLVSDLEETSPHFIRCIKPNPIKMPNSLDAGEVLRQLRYAGMMETIRIRQQGYSVREDHESFYSRFCIVLRGHDRAKGIEFLVKDLSERLNVTEADWQIGHSKIFLRRELARKLTSLTNLRVLVAGRTISRFGRNVAQARAIRLISAWAAYRLHKLRMYKERVAATLIVAKVRMQAQLKVFKLKLKSAIKLQSLHRQALAKQKVRHLRDPYGHLSFKELEELHKNACQALDEAIASKKFRQAADMESSLAKMKEALENKRPLTRAIIEEMIAEVQGAIENALSKKNYSECAPLQEKLDKLIERRKDYPTLDELKDCVTKAEEAVSICAAKRDFAGAAALQAALDQARAKYEEEFKAQNPKTTSNDEFVSFELHRKFSSRAELETEVNKLSRELENLVKFKDFGKANEVQAKLTAIESLRKIYPSLQELREEYKILTKEADEAVAKRDFVLAGTLHEKISAIEAKIEKEQCDNSSGTTIVDINAGAFASRAELELKISKLSQEVEKAVERKDFEVAKKKQDEVESLISLRSDYPTADEIQKQLEIERSKMENAISSKNFSFAKELNDKIEELTERFEKERKKEIELKQAGSELTECFEIERKEIELKPSGSEKKDLQVVVHAIHNQSKVVSNKPSVSKTVVAQKFNPNTGTKSHVLKSATSDASVSSVKSFASIRKTSLPAQASGSDARPVSKFRPKKPLISSFNDSVLGVTQMLASKRGDAALIADKEGGLVGIITDTDITRRLVSKFLDPSQTEIHEIMTPNPACVSMNDSAMDALGLMVENHFRHLPVLDDTGSIVGLLDIAKCLNDAISKLEKANAKSKVDAENVVKEVVGLKDIGEAKAAALQMLLGPLMEQALGGKTSPTLRSLLQGKPKTIIDKYSTIRDAALVMAESRKAALIVEDGELVGIFGFKDMMTRVVAKELPIDSTEVSEVMTLNPETVLPDITVIEALQIMHDSNFLTLPVRESNGTVVGLVDVMDLIYNCGGTDGWRSIFGNAMDCDDDLSDVASVGSRGSKSQSVRSVKSTRTKSSVISGLSSLKESNDERPVSKLRPNKPLICQLSQSVLEVTQMLASKRGDATIVAGEDGRLAGILTDTDITRRVVAHDRDPASTNVSLVMTLNPKCVSTSDSATDALNLMVENHFRHLPVLDDNGAIVGLLDIAKCLNDALCKLERAHQKGKMIADDVFKRVTTTQSGAYNQAAALQMLLGPLMAKAFGGTTSPTLRTLIGRRPATIVSPNLDIASCGKLMAESRKAALVVDDGELVGIFGFKDMMVRAVAKRIVLAKTQVSSVMTPSPEFVSPDITVTEALQIMHDNKFLTLPVCESNGKVVGLVDVMDLIYGCGGTEGWKSIFSNSIKCADDESDTSSVRSSGSAYPSVKSGRTSRDKVVKLEAPQRPVSDLRPKKPLISSVNDSTLGVTQMLAAKRGDASLIAGNNGRLAGIITDTDITRRLVAEGLDASKTEISAIMTPNPTCVSMNDSAMDALGIMVQNRFRHLPVLDERGAIVGLLDIAKCLNDAISKLERAGTKGKVNAENAVKDMISMQGAAGAQAAALKMLLSPLLSQAFGGASSPTLRSLLAGKPKTLVSSSTKLRRVAKLMAESRKAALVVDSGVLVGIFGFKDMMTRAVAKELPIDKTDVSEVMTPNPEYVSPELTVVEALQVMHDNKFLTLPVCESDGKVVGLVDVMDLIYSSGGTEGWRSVFDSAMDADDDMTDTSSVLSAGSHFKSVKSSQTKHTTTTKHVQENKAKDRPVSKLRPSKPLIADERDTVVDVCKMLAQNRGRASLLASSSGALVGIITDHDIVRRVVAKSVDPASTTVASIMTRSPKCVSISGSAIDALSTMIENHYRYLPVLDKSDAIVGLLDIGKVLNDAISKLERKYEKSNSAAEEAFNNLAAMQGTRGSHSEALKMLLKPMMAQAFGGVSSPTLRSLLAGKRKIFVDPSTTILAAAIQMAETHKAALVVEQDLLVGIVSFKDVMTRALAKAVNMDCTPVSEIMTENPEHVTPEVTVVDAMQIMHDNKFLTLPVCENDGTVVGVVDVMDLIYGCGGTEGWRSIFDDALDAADDLSEAGSHQSGQSLMKLAKTSRTIESTSRSQTPNMRVSEARTSAKPVSKLRPAKSIIIDHKASVLDVCQLLANKRGAASLIMQESHGITGILTDHDIVRRVVAKRLDPSTTCVSKVMTRDPYCVAMSDSAIDALTTMIENHYRYLPVMDDNNNEIVGLLDIGKVLYDAITKLERAYEKCHTTGADVETHLKNLSGLEGPHAEALKMLLKPMMAQAFGGASSPTLRSLLAGKQVSFASPETSILEAGIKMADSHKAIPVVENGKLIGIVSFKDVMSRALAKCIQLDRTAVSVIMTPYPENVTPDTTVVEAMQIMHDNKFLTLPVCEEDGSLLGVVDVMDLIYGCGGAAGWRSIFDRAMEADDATDTLSEFEESVVRSLKVSNRPLLNVASVVEKPLMYQEPKPIETIEFAAEVEEASFHGSIISDLRSRPPKYESMSEDRDIRLLAMSADQTFVFKVVDVEGNIHRINCEAILATLLINIAAKLGDGVNASSLQIKFIDDEGDTVVISSDDGLLDAIAVTKKSGVNALKLSVSVMGSTSVTNSEVVDNKMIFIAVGLGSILAFAGIAIILMKPRK